MPLELNDGDVQFLWQLRASAAAADETAVAETAKPARRGSVVAAVGEKPEAGNAEAAGGRKRRRAPRLGMLGGSISRRQGM